MDPSRARFTTQTARSLNPTPLASMPNKGLTVSLLILLVINALLLAAAWGVFGPEPLAGWLESPREPQRVDQQVRKERMEVVPASAPGASNSTAPRGSLSSVTGVAATKVVAAATGVCLELGGFTPTGARRATEALATLPVEAFEREQQVRWWVHLPAQPTQDNADRKLAELRRRHVTDVAVVTSGTPETQMTYTVSLGLFHERERAERFLETLRGQGVRTAMISDAPRAVSRQWLRVRRVDETARAQLEDVKRKFGAEDLQACALAS